MLPESTTIETPVLSEGAETLDTASDRLFGIHPDKSQTHKTPQSEEGQAKVAPLTVEGEGTGKTAEGTATAPDKGQAETEVKDEDVLAAMSPTETPEQLLTRTKREATASRSEALRLKKVDEGTRDILKNQGLELVLDSNGNVTGLAPTDGYNGGASEKMMSLKFTDMSQEQQDRFENDPQALIDHVLSHAKTGMARVAPTVEKPFASISPEKEQATFDYVAGLILEDGVTKKHPNIARNKAIIQQNINAPSNAALKEFFHRQPDLAVAFLDSYGIRQDSFLLRRRRYFWTQKTRKSRKLTLL